MNHHDLLRDSIAATQAVLDQGPLTSADLGRATPCSDFDVAQLGEHLIDTHVLLLGAAGGSPGELTGALADRHRTVGAASVERWRERGTDGTIDVGGHQLPAPFGLSLHTIEAFVHGWDLAAGLGRPFDVSDRLVDAMADLAHTVISDEMRGDFDGAPYAAAVDLDGAASTALDRLVAFAGRDPAAARG